MRRLIVSLLVTAFALVPLASPAAVTPKRPSASAPAGQTRTGVPRVAKKVHRVAKKRAVRHVARRPATVKAAKKAPGRRTVVGAGASI